MKLTWIQLIKSIICYILILQYVKKNLAVSGLTQQWLLKTNTNATGHIKLQVSETMVEESVAYQNLHLLNFREIMTWEMTWHLG